MARTIVVPLDGSPLAERAIPFAVSLAGATEAQLLLVQAVWSRDVPGIDATDTRLAEMVEAEAYLDARSRELARQGITAETTAVFAPPVEAIIEESSLRDAELIVMTTHGRGGLGRWIMGSTATALLAKAPAPILLVRAWHSRRAVERLRQGAAVLVPLDGSALAEEALPVAKRLAKALHGEVVLIGVVPPTDTALTPAGMAAALFHDDTYRRTAEARDYLVQLTGRLAAQGYAASHEVRAGQPAATIDAIGRERGASVVVMATHGRSGLDRLLLGSVAEAVVRAGSFPTLLVRAGLQGAGASGAPAETPQRSGEEFLPLRLEAAEKHTEP